MIVHAPLGLNRAHGKGALGGSPKHGSDPRLCERCTHIHTHQQVHKRIHTLNTPMDLYKGFYPRSRPAGSLSSAGAQQGSLLARLADCAQLGATRMAQGGEWDSEER